MLLLRPSIIRTGISVHQALSHRELKCALHLSRYFEGSRACNDGAAVPEGIARGLADMVVSKTSLTPVHRPTPIQQTAMRIPVP